MILLHDLQQRAYRAIAERRGELLEPWLRTGGGVPWQTRLAVYENNLRETCRQALAACYPLVERLVGEACFRGLAAAYAREHPSRSGDLADYGGAFPQLLNVLYAGTEHDYLRDVARLERACAEAARADERAPIGPAALSAVTDGGHPALRFELHPAVRLVGSRYPLLTIWEAQQSESGDTVDLRSPAEQVLVYRRGPRVLLRRLEEATFAFVHALHDGEPLLDAQDAALAADAAFSIGGALAELFRLGLIVGFGIDQGY